MPPDSEDMTDLDQPATKRDFVESFKAEFSNLYDWTRATTSTLGQRVDHLESNHGSRLRTLETRVARLEKRRK